MKKPIGYISYSHGLDGKVKIVPMVSSSDFKEYIAGNVYVDNDRGGFDSISVSIVVFNGKVFLCKIEGCNSIEETGSFLKKEVFIDADDKDFISGEKLLGFKVYRGKICNNGLDTGCEYGEIIDYGDYGGGELIEVKVKGKKRTEFYRCDNNDIKDIDYKNKKIAIIIRDEC